MTEIVAAHLERVAREVAPKFHEAYERLAPQFGYETRKESAVPWEQVPEPNRKLMEAVCKEVVAAALAACAREASDEQAQTDVGRVKCWVEGTGAHIDSVLANPNIDPAGKLLAEQVKRFAAKATLEEVRWWDANADDLQMLWAESRKRIAALERAAGEKAQS